MMPLNRSQASPREDRSLVLQTLLNIVTRKVKTDIAASIAELSSLRSRDWGGKSFIHVLNVSSMEPESFALQAGIEMRRATREEAEAIRQLNEFSEKQHYLLRSRNPWETRMEKREDPNGAVSFTAVDLPEQEWCYFVLSFSGSNVEAHRLVNSTVLARQRLLCGAEVLGIGGTAFAYGGPTLDRFRDSARFGEPPFQKITEPDLVDIKSVTEQLAQTSNDPTLLDAMQRFTTLDAIPRASPLLFLGYISILESLITHAPKPQDPYDSLTRQVRQKMILIAGRSTLPIPYGLFESAASPGQIWTKLYAYRSAIAHGAHPDFKKEFRLLGDSKKALEFVERSTMAVMRQFLSEPKLMNDLREC